MSSIIITATLATTAPILDWSATAAWLGIFATLAISIITPAVSTYLNNRFQLRLKDTELKYLHTKESYSKKLQVYEGILQTLGKFIHYSSDENASFVGQHLYELYLYLPTNHWPILDRIIYSIDQDNWKNISQDIIELSKVLSEELRISECKPNLKKKRTPRKQLTDN